jgi:phosphatidylglycerol:prolipoprotein diacylglycerol transferase
MLGSIGWPVIDRFRFGSVFAISPHGLGIAIGFLIGSMLLIRICRRWGLDPDHVNTMLMWALVGTIVGARLAYVVAHYSDFKSPIEILEVWKGGISLLGGIAGAIIINIRRMRRYGYSVLQVLDPAAVALAMGIGIGRVGDLIIGDHLGKPTSWLLAWTYHGGTLPPPWSCSTLTQSCTALLQGGATETITRTGARLFNAAGDQIAQGVGVHPTALYDMIGAWVLFALLWRVQKKPRRRGVLALTFGIWYGCMRLIEDSVRIDKRFGPFTGSQWTALAVVVVSAITLIVWARRAQKGDPGPTDMRTIEEDEPEPAPAE